MVALAGPFIVAAALLGAAGALKIRSPATTAQALGEMGMPSSPALVRAGAAVEVAIAAGALIAGSTFFAALVALSYLGFAGFVAAALLRGVPLSSCGCFGGADDTPPSVIHLVLTIAAAAAATAVALRSGHAGLAHVVRVDGSILLTAVFLVLTGVSAWLAYVALTLLPRVLGAGPADPAGVPDEPGFLMSRSS